MEVFFHYFNNPQVKSVKIYLSRGNVASHTLAICVLLRQVIEYFPLSRVCGAIKPSNKVLIYSTKFNNVMPSSQPQLGDGFLYLPLVRPSDFLSAVNIFIIFLIVYIFSLNLKASEKCRSFLISRK